MSTALTVARRVATKRARKASAARDGLTRAQRFDLGLSLLQVASKPGARHSHETIAVFCECSRTRVQSIERRALAKLRAALQAAGHGPEILRVLAPEPRFTFAASLA